MVDGWMCLQTPSTQTNKDYIMPQAPKPHTAAHQHTFPLRGHTHIHISQNCPSATPNQKKSLTSIKLAGKGKTKTYSWFLSHPFPSLVGLVLGSSQPFLPSLSWPALLHPFLPYHIPPYLVWIWILVGLVGDGGDGEEDEEGLDEAPLLPYC